MNENALKNFKKGSIFNKKEFIAAQTEKNVKLLCPHSIPCGTLLEGKGAHRECQKVKTR